MKLIEHLEHVLGLVEQSAPYSEIKGSLLAMREEIEGYEQAASNQVALAKENAALKASLSPPLAGAPPDSFSCLRGLYYQAGDSIPFCPKCWEASGRKIHLSGPVPMMDTTIEYWECHTCDKDYDAKPGQNFLARAARKGRTRH
jgi:hypothetical protein